MISLRQLQDVTRADFVRSVGLYFMNDRIIMVRLRKSFLNVAMVEAEERQLPQGDNRQTISELTGWVAEDVRDIALKPESDARERSSAALTGPSVAPPTGRPGLSMAAATRCNLRLRAG